MLTPRSEEPEQDHAKRVRVQSHGRPGVDAGGSAWLRGRNELSRERFQLQAGQPEPEPKLHRSDRGALPEPEQRRRVRRRGALRGAAWSRSSATVRPASSISTSSSAARALGLEHGAASTHSRRTRRWSTGAFTPKYRIRAGVNRAHRAPNLGRAVHFAHPGLRWRRQYARRPVLAEEHRRAMERQHRLRPHGPARGGQQCCASEPDARDLQTRSWAWVARLSTIGTSSTQPTVGGIGIQNQLGNPNLPEEQADTLHGRRGHGLPRELDALGRLLLDRDRGDDRARGLRLGLPTLRQHRRSTPRAVRSRTRVLLIYRDPTNGNPANIDRAFNNEGRVLVDGVDLQLNWQKMLAGGGFSLQLGRELQLDVRDAGSRGSAYV